MPNHLPYTHTLNVPLPLRKKVKDELKKLESLRVISEVDTTTPWCAGMVVVPRQDGTMCIWVDLKPLNAHVLRETHSLPKVDDVLAQCTGRGKDLQQVRQQWILANPLSREFLPADHLDHSLGRFCFNKMPFGISSAPGHFQQHMSGILKGLPGVVCLMDDILIYGRDKKQHGVNLATPSTESSLPK